MLKITAYRSEKYERISEYYTKKILCTTPPEEMTDEEREELKSNKLTPMICFAPTDNPAGETDAEGRVCIGSFVSIPVQFLISAESVPDSEDTEN